MSSSFSCQPLKAMPSLFRGGRNLTVTSPILIQLGISTQKRNKQVISCSKNDDTRNPLELSKYHLAIQLGALSAITAVEPALGVTGVNNQPDLAIVLIKSGIIAFGYFLIMPPIIMNWLRIRWYRRGLVEMYLQYMCVFLFFPGLILWAPFLNFRKFPRDPSMKYPWSEPENPSQVKGGRLRYPWATIEDYE